MSAEVDTCSDTLPPGPLVPHLHQLHQLFVHLGASGNELALAEHSLSQIARYTALTPRHPSYVPPDARHIRNEEER